MIAKGTDHVNIGWVRAYVEFDHGSRTAIQRQAATIADLSPENP